MKYEGVTQNFWEDDILKKIGKMGTVAPKAAGLHVALYGALCCEPLGKFQGRNPKALSYLKVFKARK